MLRDMIDVTDDKSLTQGTIFNCAYCSLYPNNEILGLVITARCDLANKDKVKFLNFIPAIPFEIWKNKELLPLIKKQTINNLKSQYFELLCKAGFSQENLKVYGYDRIYPLILEQKKITAKEITRLKNLKERLDCLEQTSPYNKILTTFNSETKVILKEIIENKNPDYFFIDDVAGYDSVVVNLREIYELRIDIAKKIQNGIELDCGESLPGLNINIENKFCSIVGQMRSPFIELLMQRFANNFVRIGVVNHNIKFLEKIMEI
ncbi:hypothetical protein ACK327_10440 [Aeromonas dhakensis]|uniref:hypothetical protein n=1 Tax=Aeromonas dhakensis TaxID=196024 RepID=UPI00191F14B9|nr:hypothetical protein [Aeromonas dhakensis]MBL0674955.1 hypothetical protein [Aeromonas dhakensis]